MLLHLLALNSFAQDTTATVADATTAAWEGGGFDGHGFRFVGSGSDPRDPLEIERPGTMTALGWSVGAAVDYASRPVVFEDASGTRTTALSDLAALDLAASFVPVAPLRFGLSMPVFLTSSSEIDQGTLSATGAVASGPTSGDLRASVLGAVVQPQDANGFGVGLLAALDLPTGTPDRWLGTPGVAGLLGVAGTYERDALTASWQVDARLAPQTSPDEWPAPTEGGDTVDGAVGLGWLLGEAFGLGVEGHVALPMSSTVEQAIGIPAEALLTGRYRSSGGGYATAGLGVGLGNGAGASPVRLVVGGGFGTPSKAAPKDTDQDGLADKADGCKDQPETANGYRDDDGCPDELPSVTFVAKLDGAEQPDADLTVTGPKGTTNGAGKLVVPGLPGDKLVADAALGACRLGTAQGVVPEADGATVEVPLARAEGKVALSVTDGAGRPLEGVQVRYVIPDEACRPEDTSVRSGRGIHTMGAGPVKMFVTAMGYDVAQETFDLKPGEQKVVEAKLKPTSVSIVDGRIQTKIPITFEGDATLDAKSAALVDQVASLVLSTEDTGVIEIDGFGSTKKVAQARADAVKAALVSSGVAPELLNAVGKGTPPRGQTEVVRFVLTRP